MRLKNIGKIFILMVVVVIGSILLTGCDSTSVTEEQEYQEDLAQRANDTVGKPNISNFTEKKLAKAVIEMRDDPKLVCYLYTKSDMTGKFAYIGRTMGYGLPYSTQYTNPEKATYFRGETIILKQQDPNGLYSGDGLDATWIWLIDETTGEPAISYMEPQSLITPVKLPRRVCDETTLPDDYDSLPSDTAK